MNIIWFRLDDYDYDLRVSYGILYRNDVAKQSVFFKVNHHLHL